MELPPLDKKNVILGGKIQGLTERNCWTMIFLSFFFSRNVNIVISTIESDSRWWFIFPVYFSFAFQREGISIVPLLAAPPRTLSSVRGKRFFSAISSGLLVTQVFHPNWLPPPRPDYFYNFSWRPPSLYPAVGATLWRPPWSETKRLHPFVRPAPARR